MPNFISNRMEDMSVAYVKAICAKDGYTYGIENHDNYGIDCRISCPGKPSNDPECKRTSPVMEVQLKSSYSSVEILPNGDVKYDLPARNYNLLIDENRLIPYILVLLVMPEDEHSWLSQTTDFLQISKCAYWACLKGREITNNKSTVRITIPSRNVFSPEALRNIMIKISKEVDL